MSPIATNKRARLRHALTGGVSAAVLVLWAGPALAQEEADDAPTTTATGLPLLFRFSVILNSPLLAGDVR